MFTNASLPNILFDKMDRGLEHEKNNILLNTVSIIFLKKTFMDDEINDLQVMLVESKYCTERDGYL